MTMCSPRRVCFFGKWSTRCWSGCWSAERAWSRSASSVSSACWSVRLATCDWRIHRHYRRFARYLPVYRAIGLYSARIKVYYQVIIGILNNETRYNLDFTGERAYTRSPSRAKQAYRLIRVKTLKTHQSNKRSGHARRASRQEIC